MKKSLESVERESSACHAEMKKVTSDFQELAVELEDSEPCECANGVCTCDNRDITIEGELDDFEQWLSEVSWHLEGLNQ